MAGLVETKAWVAVRPPLSARGLTCGSVFRISPGPLRKPPGAEPASPPAASSARLWPNEVTVAPLPEMKFGDDVPLARAKILFVTSRVPLFRILAAFELFAPRLLAKVQFVRAILLTPVCCAFSFEITLVVWPLKVELNA